MDSIEIAFSIIAEAGDARSTAMEAVAKAQQGDFPAAEELLSTCADALQKAHQVQTDLIAREMSGEGSPVNLIMAHAQDHLMCAGIMKDMATLLLEQWKRIDALERKK